MHNDKWRICHFLLLRAVVNIPIQTLIISQDDYLTAGAWAACAQTNWAANDMMLHITSKYNFLGLFMRVK